MKFFELNSDAIDRKGLIDPRYTCDMDNSSPELRWSEPPTNTAEYALLAQDIDVLPNPFTHWVVYHIPVQIRHLPAGIPPQESLPNGIRQGVNGYGKLGYSGPCPPMRDQPHRYYFRIYALKQTPEVPPRPSYDQLWQAIKSLVICNAEICGKYQRIAQKAG